jgi:hypothetical protein
MGWKPGMSPCIGSKDCGIERRCKLFLGTELERDALVQEALFVGPPHGTPLRVRSGNLQAESYLAPKPLLLVGRK